MFSTSSKFFANHLEGGDVVPEAGEVMINGDSVIHHPQRVRSSLLFVMQISCTNQARLSLGICPQFTPIETQLTVREHLLIYGRLKGLNGTDLQHSVDVLLRATGLDIYAQRLACKLSGGNQRKVALCAAIIGKFLCFAVPGWISVLLLLGNPPVILIDEFSTGVDARMRREMWQTLRTVAHGKAIVITTRAFSPRVPNY